MKRIWLRRIKAHLKKWPAARFIFRHRTYFAMGLAGIAAILFLWAVFAPQKIPYNYGASRSCAPSPRLFPGLSTISKNDTFKIERSDSAALFGIPLFARTICASVQGLPREHTNYAASERLFGLPFLGRSLTVQAPVYPKLMTRFSSEAMLPPDAVLALKLNTPDTTFNYALDVGNAQSSCAPRGAQLTCKLSPLKLTYATSYKASIVRKYKKQSASKLSTLSLRTVTPTSIAKTSIAPGGVVQDKPKSFTLVTDKKLTSAGDVQLVAKLPDGKEQRIPVQRRLEDKSIIVTWKQELARKVPFEVRIASVKAVDGSGFKGVAYKLPFSTSGGPKANGTNIGVRDVGFSQSIAISFDQNLHPSQPVAPNAALTVNGKPMGFRATIRGNTLTITPAAPYPLCAPITIRLNGQFQNLYGINGDSTWKLTSRAICYTTFSIGRSVNGRWITGYRFGGGPQQMVYMGGTHGSEHNSKRLMDEWFSEVNRHPERIPAHRSVIIIPSVNPDGIAAGSRSNARGVDLNRNFPANDWKSMVSSPGSSQPTPAGGPAPLSEPESQAIASYIRQTRPRLVMSFHSKAAVVEANESADSIPIAATYASKARYRAIPRSQSGSVFKYDTTGAMESWMHDVLGLPAVVVELATSYSSEFSRNRSALWYSVEL